MNVILAFPQSFFLCLITLIAFYAFIPSTVSPPSYLLASLSPSLPLFILSYLLPFSFFLSVLFCF